MTGPGLIEQTIGGLHALRAGQGQSGPTIILLHYFGGSSREWCLVMNRLAPTRSCIAVDLPGFGRSPPLATYTLDTMADAVEALVRSLGVNEYLLAGHSMSGKIAAVIAARHPPALRGLVLVAPSPPTPEPMDEAKRNRALNSHGSRSAALATMETIPAHRLDPELLEQQVADNVATSPEAWAWWLEEGSRVDVVNRVGQIEVPIVVVGGSADPVITPEILEQDVVVPLKAHIEKVVTADSGHLIPLEAPDVLTETIDTFDNEGRPRQGS
jgi:pimeloyl-ACP methyl ester carboxylesterase